MRSSRVTWTFCLALLGAAAIGLAGARASRGLADEWSEECMPGFYAEADIAPLDDLASDAAPAPLDDVDPIDDVDHFDTGPVEDQPDVSADETLTSDDTWYDADYDDAYYYEYPEEPEETQQQTADETDYPEEYYYKYGYNDDFEDETICDDYEYDYASESMTDETEAVECDEWAYD